MFFLILLCIYFGGNMIAPVILYSFQNKSNISLNFEGKHKKRNKTHKDFSDIIQRMYMHGNARKKDKPALVKVNVDKFDRIYRNDIFYLDEGYNDVLCDNITNFISLGNSIESPYMELSEENGELKINCIDGRHRYRVLKDMGMRVMPITMSSESQQLAKKHGLLAVDIRA